MFTPTAVASPEITTATAETEPPGRSRSAGTLGTKPAAIDAGSPKPTRIATTAKSATIIQTIARISRSKPRWNPERDPKESAVGTAHARMRSPIAQRGTSQPATAARSTSTADASEYCAKCQTTEAITVPIAQPQAKKPPA